MNQQKRHLTVMSIIITLALAMLSYAGQAVGMQALVADSHVDRYVCSHNSKPDPAASLAARAKVVVKGHAAAGALKKAGGQIG